MSMIPPKPFLDQSRTTQHHALLKDTTALKRNQLSLAREIVRTSSAEVVAEAANSKVSSAEVLHAIQTSNNNHERTHSNNQDDKTVQVGSEEAGLRQLRSLFHASRGVSVGKVGLDLVSRRFRSICYGGIYGA
jgi:hypothetical protein